MSKLSLKDQLEAEALDSNQQLLDFSLLRSKDINWREYVVPLKHRADGIYLQRHFNNLNASHTTIGDHNRRELLVCHDMMGNYLEDRHYHSSMKFDDYRFYHWSAVDYFCYFSHHYITIPPSGWINAAHKHGVRVLGTFITEGTQGERLLEEVLQSKQMIDDIVNALLRLCKHYGFEGWLVNIECKVNTDSMEKLFYFLNTLFTRVGGEVSHGVMFWYDSIIDSGAVHWQNELNAKNLRFFHASHGMLINYSWDEKSLNATQSLCETEKLAFQKVFFGIDVFGRGQVAKFQSKQTLARIRNKCFSTGIFAPAWTYETLQHYGYNIKQRLGSNEVNEAFLQRNDKFWSSLWEHLATHPYNELPFYTDFCLGSGKYTYLHGKRIQTDTAQPSGEVAANANEAQQEFGEPFFNLSRQSLQPTVPLHQVAGRCYDDAFNGGSCLRLFRFDRSFRLFAGDFHLAADSALVCAYAYKLQPMDGKLDIILRLRMHGNIERDCYAFLGDYNNSMHIQEGRCYISPLKNTYQHLLNHADLCHEIPFNFISVPYSTSSNLWSTRYYLIRFDDSIAIKDIGVLYRRGNNANDTAYLGAFYLNACIPTVSELPVDSNAAFIKLH